MRILILGGAGFIGSNIAHNLSAHNQVVVFDNLCRYGGGELRNLEPLRGNVEVIIANDLSASVNFDSVDVLIDSIGLTNHGLGQNFPEIDFRINYLSRLNYLKIIAKNKGCLKKIVALGTISQLNGPGCPGSLCETSAPRPADIQGVHKVAAELLLEQFASELNIPVVSVRVPPTFGRNFFSKKRDSGLIGNLIMASVTNTKITLFNARVRKRPFLYVDNLVKVIASLTETEWSGFITLNIPVKYKTLGFVVDQLLQLGCPDVFEFADLASVTKTSNDSFSSSITSSNLARLGIDLPKFSYSLALKQTLHYAEHIRDKYYDT